MASDHRNNTPVSPKLGGIVQALYFCNMNSAPGNLGLKVQFTSISRTSPVPSRAAKSAVASL